MTYNPEHTPDPTWWLGLDESERMVQVTQAFEARGESAPRLRAIMQAVVETQIATQDPPEVGAAAERLTDEGLRRPVVLRVLTLTMMKQMQQSLAAGRFDRDAYTAEVDAMTGAALLAEALGAPEPGGS